MPELEIARGLPIYTVVPFVLMLLSIAILPLSIPHWWDSNRNKAIISIVLGVPTLIYIGSKSHIWVEHQAVEYILFIILLASLYVVSGGIYISGSLSGTPLTNTFFLLIGSVLASFIGTTGASMILIRAIIRANEKRRYKVHTIIFFIFLVSNIGGLLTPLGDPPLFLGFLRGVPFLWTFSLILQWAFMVFILLIIYNFLDEYLINKEEKERPEHVLDEVLVHQPVKVFGLHNVIFLIGIIATVFLSGYFHLPKYIQGGCMIMLAVLSILTTKKEIHEQNKFTYHPIVEVAVLFAGIFATVIPALKLLEARGGEYGITQPWQFFWMTGSLSSFLDNAPTYLVFTALASGFVGTSAEHLNELANHQIGSTILKAISLGAVFMGANTYIGNAPNFMVKSIAEEQKIKMPSFFGYMLWSVVILVPLFVVFTLIFLI